MGCLRKECGNDVWDTKEFPSQLRKNSKMYSTDSLDGRGNLWDPGRRGSCGSSGHEDEGLRKVEILCIYSKYYHRSYHCFGAKGEYNILLFLLERCIRDCSILAVRIFIFVQKPSGYNLYDIKICIQQLLLEGETEKSICIYKYFIVCSFFSIICVFCLLYCLRIFLIKLMRYILLSIQLT